MSWLAALAAFGLAVLLLPNTPGVGDSAEFTLALALGGLPHPTGYPLYVMFGHLFVKLVHGAGVPWVMAANLWSAAGSAVATGFLVALARRLAAVAPSGSRAIERLAALTVASIAVLHPIWMIAATQAEVYSWWYAWVAGAVLYVFVWLERVGSVPAAGTASAGTETATLSGSDTETMGRASVPGNRWALGWGAICGLGLAHHLMSAFFALPLTLVAIMVLGRMRALRPAVFACGCFGALVPLASYGFVAWRAFHPVTFQWPIEPTWASVWLHIRGAAYGGYLGGFAPLAWQARLIREAVLPFMLLLAIVGVWSLRVPDRSRPWFLAVLSGAVALVAFVFGYGVPDPALYFVPALMIGSLAAIPIVAWVARRTRLAVAVAFVVAIAAATGAWSVRLSLEERARLARVDATLRTAWAAIPFDQGIVLWNDDHSTRLRLFQVLEGSRLGLHVENPNLLTWGATRRRFAERFGFDPAAGVELKTQADVARVADNVRRLAPVPVLDFPEVLERVRLANATH